MKACVMFYLLQSRDSCSSFRLSGASGCLPTSRLSSSHAFINDTNLSMWKNNYMEGLGSATIRKHSPSKHQEEETRPNRNHTTMSKR